MQNSRKNRTIDANITNIWYNSGKKPQGLPHFGPIHRHNIEYDRQKTGIGAGNLLGFLVVSIFTGLACALVSWLAFDAGFWTASLWYVIGCWSGFAAPVAACLVAYVAPKTSTDQTHPGFP